MIRLFESFDVGNGSISENSFYCFSRVRILRLEEKSKMDLWKFEKSNKKEEEDLNCFPSPC